MNISEILRNSLERVKNYVDGKYNVASSNIGELNNLQTTNKDNVVNAVNELNQGVNDGKELIADAIGEPLSAEDTFNDMSGDINSLLNTFKTNMMINGVAIESGDKFKALIDKLATLADNEGKGIQMASGTVNAISADTSKPLICSVSGFSFTPDLIFVWNSGAIRFMYNSLKSTTTSEYYYATTSKSELAVSVVLDGTNTYVREGEFALSADIPSYYGTNTKCNWVAYGVGEEDTTLRDSLASVLEDEGVEVLEEDTMADLIVKTDEEFDRKNANSCELNTPIPENTNVCIYYDANAAYYGGSEWAAEGANLIEGFEMPVSGTVRFETVLLCTGRSGTKLYCYINDSLYSTDDCTTSNTPTMTIPNTGIWDALTYDNDDMQAYLIQKELTVKKGDVIRVFADNSSPSYYYGFALYTAALRCSF